MSNYQLLWDSIIRNNIDGSVTAIPKDEANADYQQYLAWLAEGNEPEVIDL